MVSTINNGACAYAAPTSVKANKPQNVFKLLTKEDLLPPYVNKFFYLLAPFMAVSLALVSIAVILVAFLIYFKAVKLVVTEGAKWRQEAIKKNVAFKPVLGERGNIVGEDGSLLATSLPYYDLYLDYFSLFLKLLHVLCH